MDNHYQTFPYLSMNNIQNDYNAMLKEYISHFRMAIQIYTKPKGYVTNNKKGSPIHAISKFNQKCTKRGFDSVGDFDFDTPESDS